MAKYSHELTLNNNIEEVFAYISNPVNNPVWDTSVLKSPDSVEDNITTGMTGKSVSSFLGKSYDTNFIYDHVAAPRFVSNRTTAPRLEVEMRSGLKKVQRGTHLTIDINIKFRGFRKLWAPLLAKKIKSRICSNLETLQIYLRFKSLQRV